MFNSPPFKYWLDPVTGFHRIWYMEYLYMKYLYGKRNGISLLRVGYKWFWISLSFLPFSLLPYIPLLSCDEVNLHVTSCSLEWSTWRGTKSRLRKHLRRNTGPQSNLLGTDFANNDVSELENWSTLQLTEVSWKILNHRIQLRRVNFLVYINC